MMEKKDVVFGIGSAGTGKTYLAVAKAVKLLYRERRFLALFFAAQRLKRVRS
jgi:phosphate starvation-inducible protein PhoH